MSGRPKGGKAQDAARLLPMLGIFLLLFPILWGGSTRSTAKDGLYLFGLWLGLILAAKLLAPALAKTKED